MIVHVLTEYLMVGEKTSIKYRDKNKQKQNNLDDEEIKTNVSSNILSRALKKILLSMQPLFT